MLFLFFGGSFFGESKILSAWLNIKEISRLIHLQVRQFNSPLKQCAEILALVNVSTWEGVNGSMDEFIFSDTDAAFLRCNKGDPLPALGTLRSVLGLQLREGEHKGQSAASCKW